MALDTTRNRAVILGNNQFYVFDLANPNAAPTTPTLTGVAGGVALRAAGNPSLIYDAASDRYLGWIGGAAVYSLHPTTWVWTTLTLASGNAVTPTAPNPQGTYGRFAYSPRLHGIVVVNSTTENVYFLKL
jgi:hypothetical protein